MQKGNILVIGNSGVGKSTLINAVLGKEVAKTDYGITGTTNELEIYESENVPFRVIDTIGFEPTFLKEQKAIRAVKKWSKESAKNEKEDTQINVIWFCVDGTSRKLFTKTIQSLSRATSMWKSIPLVVVITKSYSVPERKENIEMVQNAFAAQGKYAKNLKKIIPVVASTYELNETAYVAPEGITELIDVTNELMPEGIQAGLLDIELFKLNRKRVFAHGVVGTAMAAAVAVGVVPKPIPDVALLVPIERAEITSIAKVYGIKNDDTSKDFFNAIVEMGTISLAAKTLVSALHALPVAGQVLNAIVAGVIVVALGEGCIYAFEQVHLGKKTLQDIDWIKKVMESKLTMQIVDEVKEVLNNSGNTKDAKKILEELFKAKKR